jgi:hypothetical protein
MARPLHDLGCPNKVSMKERKKRNKKNLDEGCTRSHRRSETLTKVPTPFQSIDIAELANRNAALLCCW